MDASSRRRDASSSTQALIPGISGEGVGEEIEVDGVMDSILRDDSIVLGVELEGDLPMPWCDSGDEECSLLPESIIAGVFIAARK